MKNQNTKNRYFFTFFLISSLMPSFVLAAPMTFSSIKGVLYKYEKELKDLKNEMSQLTVQVEKGKEDQSHLETQFKEHQQQLIKMIHRNILIRLALSEASRGNDRSETYIKMSRARVLGQLMMDRVSLVQKDLKEIQTQRQVQEQQQSLMVQKEMDLREKIQDLLFKKAALAMASKVQGPFPKHYFLPVDGRIIKKFGQELASASSALGRESSFHRGISIEAKSGSPVHSVADGKVVFLDQLPSYGKTVILEHPGSIFTVYSGLTYQRSLKLGSLVRAQQVLGSVNGASLYFEHREKNIPLDPSLRLANLPSLSQEPTGNLVSRRVSASTLQY